MTHSEQKCEFIVQELKRQLQGLKVEKAEVRYFSSSHFVNQWLSHSVSHSFSFGHLVRNFVLLSALHFYAECKISISQWHSVSVSICLAFVLQLLELLFRRNRVSLWSWETAWWKAWGLELLSVQLILQSYWRKLTAQWEATGVPDILWKIMRMSLSIRVFQKNTFSK